MIVAHPQYKVKKRPSDKKGFPVDIAVFEEVENKKILKIIVECKKKTKKDRIEQLKNYLSLSEANIGIWFNGTHSVYIKK